MNICVFLGSSFGNDLIYQEKIKELGKMISNHHTLVYGGSNSGLMGLLGKTVLDNKGRVIGVETKYFMDHEMSLLGLSELIVTENISKRIEKMISISDLFIVYPGGTGTLEEAFNVISKIAFGEINSKILFYNLNGYYDSIKSLLNQMVLSGFSSNDKIKNIYFLNDLSEFKKIIN